MQARLVEEEDVFNGLQRLIDVSFQLPWTHNVLNLVKDLTTGIKSYSSNMDDLLFLHYARLKSQSCIVLYHSVTCHEVSCRAH